MNAFSEPRPGRALELVEVSKNWLPILLALLILLINLTLVTYHAVSGVPPSEVCSECWSISVVRKAWGDPLMSFTSLLKAAKSFSKINKKPLKLNRLLIGSQNGTSGHQ